MVSEKPHRLATCYSSVLELSLLSWIKRSVLVLGSSVWQGVLLWATFWGGQRAFLGWAVVLAACARAELPAKQLCCSRSVVQACLNQWDCLAMPVATCWRPYDCHRIHRVEHRSLCPAQHHPPSILLTERDAVRTGAADGDRVSIDWLCWRWRPMSEKFLFIFWECT